MTLHPLINQIFGKKKREYCDDEERSLQILGIGELSRSLGVRTPVLDVAAASFERAIAEGYGGFDFSVIAPLHAREAGVELPGGPAPPGDLEVPTP